jgi:hypothetical protein
VGGQDGAVVHRCVRSTTAGANGGYKWESGRASKGYGGVGGLETTPIGVAACSNAPCPKRGTMLSWHHSMAWCGNGE